METTKMDVLWRCPKCNGEYRYSIAERKVEDDSCPYCQSRKRFIFSNQQIGIALEEYSKGML